MITAATCDGYLTDIQDGIHRPGDTYKLALYTDSVTLSAKTERYSAAHEVPDSGSYRAGGLTLQGRECYDGSVCFDDPQATKATITARGGLIYNASKQDRAIAVLDFKADVKSVAGTFTVELPVPVVMLRGA